MDDQAFEMPNSIEAEQQVLGALMLDNGLSDRINGIIEASSFYDPVHAAIFAAVSDKIESGALASPVTMRDGMSGHEGLSQLGGWSYLARLAGSAISGHAIKDYAKMIAETAKRRALVAIADDLRVSAVHGADGASIAIEQAEGRLYALAEGEAAARGPVSFATSARVAAEAAVAAHQRGGGLSGTATGLIDLDRKMGGLNKSDLLILAGRPSMGKTSLATNMAFNMARAGSRVGFFSLEMSHDQLTGRILSDAASISSHDLRNGRSSEDEMRRYIECANELATLPITIDDTAGISIAQLAARARRMKRTTGLDVLIVDYLQLMTGTKKSFGNRVQEIGEISMGLKAVAKDLQVPVLALSQLSRAVEQREDKRPQLSDLRESGSIEQDADIVMFVYRGEYYVEREKPDGDGPKFSEWLAKREESKGKAEVIIGKNRHGPIGTVDLSFEADFTRFGNLAKGEYGA